MMPKKILILLFLQVLLVPNLAISGAPDKVRESTILFKMDVNSTPAELKKFNALVNPGTIVLPQGAGKFICGHAVPSCDLGQPCS